MVNERLPPKALQLLRECTGFYVGRRGKLSEVVLPKKNAVKFLEHSRQLRYLITRGS